MNAYAFKTLLLKLLLVMMVNGALALEQNSENPKSWWENSKETIANMWNGSTQTLAGWFKPSTETAQFAQIWDKVVPTLDKVLVLEKEHETLPDSAWFGKVKSDNRYEINQLLDEAVGFLSISRTAETRRRIRALEEKIIDLKQNISQSREAKISAPIQSTWKTTVADYDAKIKQLTALIEHYHKEIAKLKLQFAQELSDNGLSITPEQLEVLLSSVVGNDIIQSSIVYDNIKQISQQLMTLAIDSGEDLDISQRYYGMYTVLLKTLLHMQQSFVNNIVEKYLPKIDLIRVDVQSLNITTRNLLRGESEQNRRRYLRANLKAQKLTLQTAKLYKLHLIKQHRKIVLARNKTAADLKIAQITYKTVRVSGELVNLLRTSQKSFDLLLNLQVPDLLEFKNLQMKQEFDKLTQQLAE
ncbi:MAG: hypothetical protein DRR19_15795 [Candidatus Parabeggiatoa sp. nov. 1]|nr:MAG: hypothetical protein DRR19_15795 [Gammaproteobacteria bacterium]